MLRTSRPAPQGDRDEGVDALLPGGDSGPCLGLVAAPDGATALTACGWRPEGGATVAAMVRSGQHRYGVRLCALGGVSTVVLTVGWPPRTLEHARRVLAEQIAFCPDLLQMFDELYFDTWAAGLVDASVWTPWWD